jgi:hypothetical protein
MLKNFKGPLTLNWAIDIAVQLEVIYDFSGDQKERGIL